MNENERVQIQIPLAFRHEPRTDPRVGRMLEGGWSLVEMQRLNDREALVTLARVGVTEVRSSVRP